jgi:superfamily I DNA and/or RNA helicase
MPPVQLNVNYRSNETLAKWPASRFYNNDYNPIEENRKSVISLDMNAIQNDAALQNYPWLSKVLSPNYPVVVITYPAMHFTHHNPFESELVAMLCALYAKCLPSIDGFFDKRLGVVTPHRAQIKAIAKAIQHHAPDLATQDMAIDTVDRFQGQERDIIIASYAAADPWFIANEESFILDHRRFNVTLTRARKKFILIVSEPVLHHVPTQYKTASYSSHLQQFPRFDAHEVIQNATFHYAANGASRKSSTTCAIYAYPANKSSKTQEELVLIHRIKSRRLVSA